MGPILPSPASARRAHRHRDRAGPPRSATSGPPSEARVAAAPCSQEPTEAASYGVEPGGEQRADQPASTSPAPAVASHGTPVVVTRTRPSGAATRVRRPLSSTTAPYVLGGARGRGRSGRASTSPRSTPSIRASSPACGVSTAGRRSGPASVRQRVGVDDQRDAVRQRRGEGRRSAVLAAAGADHPGLDPPRRRPPRDAPAGPGRRRQLADVPHHAARARVAAPATLSSPAPGYVARAGADADHAAGVLLRVGGRAAAAAPRRPRAGAPRPPPPAGRGRCRPACTAPQADAAGSTRCATLWVPKVTVTAASTCGPSSSPVSTSTPDWARPPRPPGTPAHAVERGHRLRPQPGPSADPDDPVDHHVGSVPASPGRRRPARRPPQRGQPGLVGLAEQQPRLDRAAAAGQQRPGVQRVAAVVARPDQQQHPAPVRRPEQVDARRTPARPRPAASARPPGSGRHQRGLGRPHLLDRVGVSHPANASDPVLAVTTRPATARRPGRVDSQVSRSRRDGS